MKGKESADRYQFNVRAPYDYTFVNLGQNNNSTNIRRLKLLTSQHFLKNLNQKLYYKF